MRRVRPASAPVAINGRAAIRAEIGGVERFAREMAMRLPALRPDRYRVIRPPRAFAFRAGHLWEQAVLPVTAANARLIINPANLAPVISRRSVVVLHDAAALRDPDAYSTAYVTYQRRILPLIAARARLVLTVSEFSRRELIDLLDVPPERTRVISEGVDERFGPEVDAGSARRAYDLPERYVLAVGTLSARKNLQALEVTASALRRHGVELVAAGSLRSYLPVPRVVVRRLGYVAEHHLPGLYAGASAVVMPSRYEGFGLPCLEAMASGVPVVASNRGALPETVGPAGLIVDPDDAAAFAAAVLDAALDSSVRAPLISAGIERARAFTWTRAASALDAAVTEVLREGWRGRQ